MKRSIFFFFSLFMFSVTYAQTVEEKIAVKACECLEMVVQATNDTIRDCVIKSVVNGMEEYKAEMPKDIYTVEGMRRIAGAVTDLLPETCRTVKRKKYEAKKEKFYSDSKVAMANNYYITATDMMQSKKYDLAIEGFKVAIKLDSSFVKAYDHLAICYRSQLDYTNAIKYYDASLRIFPEGDLAMMNLGVIYTLKEDNDRALFYYNKMIDINPENPEGYFGAAKIYLLRDEYEKALSNAFTAHLIYVSEKSDYKADSEKLIKLMYTKMKEAKQLGLFKQIAKQYHININD
ncbi:MAG: tetratricopeptide repeat protein [Sphingobacteriales bacterium]|nr:MAG: tetratricopeptide repeat protein [Sphingobacteriales bacterium]